jgi:NAD-dependent DNA ligase
MEFRWGIVMARNCLIVQFLVLMHAIFYGQCRTNGWAISYRQAAHELTILPMQTLTTGVSMSQHLSEQQVTLYNTKHKENRDIDIFTGICIGMLCDGHVNIDEIKYLSGWINENQHIADKYPVSSVAKNIGRWLEDGKIDSNEELELLAALTKIVNGSTDNEDLFCIPEPAIIFDNRRIAFTGNFSYPRKQLEEMTICLGATIAKKEVSSRTDYLVVGETGSENWKHSGAGTKIIDAVSLRDNGGKIKIVREKHFVNYLVTATNAILP